MRIEPIEVRTPFAIGAVNCYAIEADALVLVDAGPAWDEAYDDLAQGLGRVGRRVEDVELLLLTHQHADHAGGAAALRERSGCKVAGHPSLAAALSDAPAAAAAEARFQAELMRRYGVPSEVVEAALAIEARFHRYVRSVELDLPLGDGAVPGLARLEARARPGHSPTDLVFAAVSDGVVFTGDHLLAGFPSVPLLHRLSPAVAPGRESALLAYRRSLAATAREASLTGLPGHGPGIPDTAATAGEWLRSHERRAERLLRRLPGEPFTAYDLVSATWRDVNPARTYVRLCEIVGGLDLLEERGAVACLDDGLPTRFLRARG